MFNISNPAEDRTMRWPEHCGLATYSRLLAVTMMSEVIMSVLRTMASERVHVQVMAACFEIFSTWDDEYDKLQSLLRDVVKKKKEDMKLAWKVNPTHKRLQARLEHMRKSVYRQQQFSLYL